MKAKRFVEQDVTDFNVGDIIEFTMSDGEYVQAMAVKKLNVGMLFCFVNCLTDRYPMNDSDTNDGSYLSSKLRTIINSKVISDFPNEIKRYLVKFSNGDYLRIPTEKEIFGKNKYGEVEADNIEQWEPMKNCNNRVSFGGAEGYCECYWCQNNKAGRSDCFCSVASDGRAYNNLGFYAHGVRPVFVLNLKSNSTTEQESIIYE